MISALQSPALTMPTTAPVAPTAKPTASNEELKKVFDQFIGETFYGQMLGAMRKSVGKPAYFHGGRAEEVFQAQMDQTLSEHMAQASAGSFSGPMFEMFTLARK